MKLFCEMHQDRYWICKCKMSCWTNGLAGCLGRPKRFTFQKQLLSQILLYIYKYSARLRRMYIVEFIASFSPPVHWPAPKWIQWLSRDLLWPLYICIYIYISVCTYGVPGVGEKLITRNVVVPRAPKKIKRRLPFYALL